ncbi:MAG TPA: hypothetical protein VHW01_15035 [Polyangiaceae bacterium]|jgi:hypothetical protein|nr:hypothetical protein [Polyangiaceae bacterium]
MTAWLWAHVYFGLLALFTAGAHAGYGLISLQFFAGKLAFFTLFGIVASGLVWRVIYAVVPRLAVRDVGNYSANASSARRIAVGRDREADRGRLAALSRAEGLGLGEEPHRYPNPASGRQLTERGATAFHRPDRAQRDASEQQLLDVTQIKHAADGSTLVDRRNEPLLEGAPGALETAIQHLSSGAVPRVRPFDHKPTAALASGEAHSFPYRFALSAGIVAKSVRVRLLFRSSPPYFLRALGVAGLAESLEVTEMARFEALLQ